MWATCFEEGIGSVSAANFLDVSVTPREISVQRRWGPDGAEDKVEKHRRVCACCQVGLTLPCPARHADGAVSQAACKMFS